jgi:hypothetical protein
MSTTPKARRRQPTPGAVKRAQLNGELVLARLAISHQFLRARITVLLCKPHAFLESRGCRLVQNLHSTARPFRDVDLIKTWVFVATTSRNDPDLPRRQRIAANAVLAVQLRRGHKLLHPSSPIE